MNLPNHVSRRRFLQAGAAGGTLAAHRWSSLARGETPADRLRVGVIGTGVRGKYLIANLPPSARVEAICDCATSRIAGTLNPKQEFREVLARFRDNDASRCSTHQDYRRMIEREDIDAVIIATPDHHHVQAAMLALNAGLDVYLEKPMSLTIREGRLLADTVKRTGRVLQVGSQQRTMEMNRVGCEFIRDGGLGKIKKVELPNYPGPMVIGKMEFEPVTPGLDWNLFLGPSPLRAHSRLLWMKDDFKVGKLLWRGWDLYRDYAGHLMTNWGAHSVDMVQYALGRDDSGPVEIRAVEPESVTAIGQAWSHKTPLPGSINRHRFWPVEMRYADGVELHFVNGHSPIRFYGERGTMSMRRNEFETDPPGLVKDLPDADRLNKWEGSGHVARPHLENWLDCVRTRGVPNAPVEVGHRTVTICHLANLARELARPLRWDPVKEQFEDDAIADTYLDRPRRRGFELPELG